MLRVLFSPYPLKQLKRLIGRSHRYKPEIPEPAPSLFRHGVQIGGSWVFSVIKITVTGQLRVYCGLIRRYCACFRVYCGQDPRTLKILSKTPNTLNWSSGWSSMADDAITRGGMGVLWSSFYICGRGRSCKWCWQKNLIVSVISLPHGIENVTTISIQLSHEKK